MALTVKRESLFRTDLMKAVRAAYGKGQYGQINHGTEFSMGLPDTEFVIQGRTAHVELKAVDSMPAHGLVFDWARQPTPLQLHTLMAIHEAGGNARVFLYVHPVKRVFVRPASWLYTYRAGLHATKRAIITTDSLDEEPWGWDWKGDKTSRDVLEEMLFGPFGGWGK